MFGCCADSCQHPPCMHVGLTAVFRAPQYTVGAYCRCSGRPQLGGRARLRLVHMRKTLACSAVAPSASEWTLWRRCSRTCEEHWVVGFFFTMFFSWFALSFRDRHQLWISGSRSPAPATRHALPACKESFQRCPLDRAIGSGEVPRGQPAWWVSDFRCVGSSYWVTPTCRNVLPFAGAILCRKRILVAMSVYMAHTISCVGLGLHACAMDWVNFFAGPAAIKLKFGNGTAMGIRWTDFRLPLLVRLFSKPSQLRRAADIVPSPH